MARNLLILLTIAFVTGGYTLWSETRSVTSAPAIDNGRTQTPHAAEPVIRKAPGFEFIDINGRTQSLSGFTGKPVILNFWASWCAPCLIEFPQMLELARNNKDVVFLFLSLDQEEADMRRFVSKMAVAQDNVFIGLDTNQNIANALYGTYKLPESYLITATGNIAFKITGVPDWESPEIKDKINALAF